ncbi:KUP/HAK/KT family potassium transporter, partial [Klebsiella pneumoniae subsp. pneumoniae]
MRDACGGQPVLRRQPAQGDPGRRLPGHRGYRLGYVPRMTIQHTSSHEQGQIYIGGVNWALMVGVVLLVLGFESSASLAAAYGVAVTGTMLITTLLMGVVIWRLWKWPLWLGVPFFCVMLAVDSLFFAANLPKVIQGGAFPVIAGIV